MVGSSNNVVWIYGNPCICCTLFWIYKRKGNYKILFYCWIASFSFGRLWQSISFIYSFLLCCAWVEGITSTNGYYGVLCFFYFNFYRNWARLYNAKSNR